MEDEKVYLEDVLSEAIYDEIMEIAKLEPGSKERTATVNSVSVMYSELSKARDVNTKQSKANDEIETARREFEETQKRFEEEMALKKKQFELEKAKFEAEQADKIAEESKAKKAAIIDVIFKGLDITVKVAGILLPLSFYAAWLEKGMEFEKEGSFTSSTLRGFMGKLKPNRVD